MTNPRMTNDECRNTCSPLFRHSSLGDSSFIRHSSFVIRHCTAFSYVATCQPVLGWGAGIVSGSGQSAIGARNLDGHAA
ncbi:MAG: hypothetical protein ACYC26_03510, partial [Phycisphaerales bacterium]